MLASNSEFVESLIAEVRSVGECYEYSCVDLGSREDAERLSKPRDRVLHNLLGMRSLTGYGSIGKAIAEMTGDKVLKGS